MPAIKCTQRSTICTFAVTSCGSATRGEDNRLTAASSMQPPCRCYGPKLLEAGGNCKWEGAPRPWPRSLRRWEPGFRACGKTEYGREDVSGHGFIRAVKD